MRSVVVITGASRGIGAACALCAAQAGYAIAVNYISNEVAAAAVVETIVRNGGAAAAIRGDIGDAAAIDALFAEADKLGPLSGLINNAGVVDLPARVDEMVSARLDRMMRINVIGPMLCARQAVLRMSSRHGGNGGSIVNVGSIAAVLGGAGQYVDYAASKGAMDTFTKGLAREVAGEGIRVNAVRPGIIDTEIHASGGVPDRVARMRDAVPMKREGSAQEVANAIVWLLGPEASYVTGAIMDISGGR